jgi:tetratricopeptide (TPR) repeat protein
MARRSQSNKTQTVLKRANKIETWRIHLLHTDKLNPELEREMAASLVGDYGAEFLHNPGGFDEVIDFWTFLVERFDSAQSKMTLADLLLLSGRIKEAIPLFLNALSQDFGLVQPGELEDTITRYGTTAQIVKYYELKIQYCRREGMGAKADEMLQRILSQYGNHENFTSQLLSRIEAPSR